MPAPPKPPPPARGTTVPKIRPARLWSRRGGASPADNPAAGHPRPRNPPPDREAAHAKLPSIFPARKAPPGDRVVGRAVCCPSGRSRSGLDAYAPSGQRIRLSCIKNSPLPLFDGRGESRFQEHLPDQSLHFSGYRATGSEIPPPPPHFSPTCSIELCNNSLGICRQVRIHTTIFQKLKIAEKILFGTCFTEKK